MLQRLKPDLLRSMLITFVLYFAFQGNLDLLHQSGFWKLSIQGLWTVALVVPILLGLNALRQSRGEFKAPEQLSDKLPFLHHPKRQLLVLLLMPVFVFVEEFLFRLGLMGFGLSHGLGIYLCIMISALIFVLGHEQRLALDRTNFMLAIYGLVFGMVYALSGFNFMAIFLTHLAVNLHAWLINVQLLRARGYRILPSFLNPRAIWAAARASS